MKVILFLTLIAYINAQTVYNAVLYESNPVIRCFEPLTEYEFIMKFSQNYSNSEGGLITTFHGFQGDYTTIYNTTSILYYRFNLVSGDTLNSDIYLWFYGKVWMNIVINKVSVRGISARYPPKGKIIYKEETTQLPLTLWVFKPNKTYTIEISLPYAEPYNTTLCDQWCKYCDIKYSPYTRYYIPQITTHIPIYSINVSFNGFISPRVLKVENNLVESTLYSGDSKNIFAYFTYIQNQPSVDSGYYTPIGCNTQCTSDCRYITVGAIPTSGSYLIVIYEQ